MRKKCSLHQDDVNRDRELHVSKIGRVQRQKISKKKMCSEKLEYGYA